MKRWLDRAIAFLLVLALAGCGAAEPGTAGSGKPSEGNTGSSIPYDVPDVPDTLEPPDEPGVPDTLEPPDEPGVPDALEPPDEPGVPDALEPPDEPGVPDTLEPPDEPGVPDASEPPESPEVPDSAETLDEDGSYTTKEDVALYIHLYGCLPQNFITKREAQALGWNGGSLEEYAPGKSIGGNRFGNYEGLLPDKEGRTYTECDINTLGARSRGAERIVFSNDGLIYYTQDHYESFELLYGDPDA